MGKMATVNRMEVRLEVTMDDGTHYSLFEGGEVPPDLPPEALPQYLTAQATILALRALSHRM